MKEEPLGLQIHTAEAEADLRAVSAALVPLALLAALLLVLGGMTGTALSAAAVLPGAAVIAVGILLPGKRGARVTVAVAALAALSLALLPAVRGGVLTLAERLFDASEAVNAYAYRRFSVPETASLPAALAAVSALLGALCAAAGRSRAAATGLFVAVALAEAYFGVTPGLWPGLLLLAALGAALARAGTNGKRAVSLLAGAVVLTAAVCLLAPRPIAAVEAYSEHLRDELGAAAMALQRETPHAETPPEGVHQESRQREESARAEESAAKPQQEFSHRTETEREIALPHRLQLLRIIAGLLLTVAVTALPLLPFLLLARARKRAAEKRAAFDDPDNASAIRAMFLHIADWLRACGAETQNRTFGQFAPETAALLSPEYAARFADAVPVWQQAAYSDRCPTDAQRAQVRALLRETERTLYERADRKKRFRLNYVECLRGRDDDEKE